MRINNTKQPNSFGTLQEQTRTDELNNCKQLGKAQKTTEWIKNAFNHEQKPVEHKSNNSSLKEHKKAGDISDKVLWTDGMRKVSRKKETTHGPKHNTSSVNHGDMGMYSRQRNCSLVFTDDVTADSSSRTNFEVYRSIITAHMQPNISKLNGRCITLQ